MVLLRRFGTLVSTARSTVLEDIDYVIQCSSTHICFVALLNVIVIVVVAYQILVSVSISVVHGSTHPIL